MRSQLRTLGVVVLLGVATAATYSSGCKTGGNDSSVLDSPSPQVAHIRRLYNNILGRDPTRAELRTLHNKDYETVVKEFLDSRQFEQNGFFNLHRERFLLNREGSEQWVNMVFNDYCALQLDMSLVGIEDKAGDGYWETVKYKRRWYKLEQVDPCLVGTDIRHLVAVAESGDLNPQPINNGNNGGGNNGGPFPTLQDGVVAEKRETAKRCLERLRFRGDYGNMQPADALKQIAKDLKEVPIEDQGQSLVATDIGQEILASLFEGSMPADKGKVTPSMVDGRPVFIQELDRANRTNCAFGFVNPANATQQFGGGGGGFGGGFAPLLTQDTNVDNMLDDDQNSDDQDNQADDDQNTDDQNNDDQDNNDPAEPAPPAAPLPMPNPLIDSPFEDSGKVLGTVAPSLIVSKLPKKQRPKGDFYVLVDVPEAVQGVHATPYWLKRHRTSKKNQHLHRSRMVFFSWMCREISPDAANAQGGPPEIKEELKKYFAEDDVHKDGAANCYNCHAVVQPMANFFGQFRTFEDPNEAASFGPPQYFAFDGFDRPGGLYNGNEFYQVNGTDRGMPGLAAVLEDNGQVADCVVKSTWNQLVGSRYDLTEKELERGRKAFGRAGNASLTRLVNHFLTKEPRGRAFYEKGETAMAVMNVEEGTDCPDEMSEAYVTAAHKISVENCGNCHTDEDPTFIKDYESFNVNGYLASFTDDSEALAKERMGKLWHELYCQVETGAMPMIPDEDFTAERKRQATCYFKKTRDELAKAGKIDASFQGKACGATSETPTEAPHTINMGDEG